MGWHNIKVRQTDRLFSRYVRLKRAKVYYPLMITQVGMPCEFCGKWKLIGLLDCSHFWSRKHENTRYSEVNVDVFCKAPCHRRLEHEKGEGREYWNWKLNQLGEEEFNKLMLAAHQTKKRDDKLTLLWLRQQDGYPWK